MVVMLRSMNIRDAIKLYRRTDAREWSRQKENALRRIERYLGLMSVTDLDKHTCIDWMLNGYPGARSTAVHAMKSLAGCLAFLADLDMVDMPNPTAPHDAVRALTRRKLFVPGKRDPGRITDPMLDALRCRWRCSAPSDLLTLLVDTPMRSGELCRILWEDVDLDPQCPSVLIRDRKDPIAKKGNHQRVPLLGRSRQIIADMPRVFPRVLPLTQGALSAAFKRATIKAGFSLVLHDLRHEGITRLAAAGFTTPELMAISGHKNPAMLARYTHIRPADLHRRARELMPDTRQPSAARNLH